jgi:hypothetical protein
VTSVFLSHASPDDALASDLEAWLRANGFSDLYVDHATTAGGEKRADSLREALVGACRVIVLLVTPAWLISTYCNSRFVDGRLLGRRIIPLLLLPDLTALSLEQGDALRARYDARLHHSHHPEQRCRFPCGADPFAALIPMSLRLRASAMRSGANPQSAAKQDSAVADLWLRLVNGGSIS